MASAGGSLLGGAGLGGIGAIIAGTAVVKMLPDFGDFDSKVSKHVGGFSQSLSKLGGTLTKAVTLPLVGIGVAAVKAFNDAEQATASVNAVLESTHHAAGLTATAVDGLAKSLSHLTGVDDDVIKQYDAMLLTFTNIGKEVFPATQQAVLDMATAMNHGSSVGADFQGTAIQIGKALQDPIRGVTALQRVGVRLTESQKDQVKAFVESGRTMDAQRLILGELKTEFGGAAEAFAGTSKGKMQRAMTELGNAGESLGAILVPVLDKVAGWAEKLAGWFEKLSPAQKKWLVEVLAVGAAVGPALLIFAKMAKALSTIRALFQTTKTVQMVAQLGNVGKAATAAEGQVGLATTGMSAAFGVLAAAIAGYEIGKVINKTVVAPIIKHFEDLHDKAAASVEGVKNAFVSQFGKLPGISSKNMRSVTAALNTVDEAGKLTAAGIGRIGAVMPLVAAAANANLPITADLIKILTGNSQEAAAAVADIQAKIDALHGRNIDININENIQRHVGQYVTPGAQGDVVGLHTGFIPRFHAGRDPKLGVHEKLAILKDDEAVINGAATRKWLPFLRMINSGRMGDVAMPALGAYRSVRGREISADAVGAKHYHLTVNTRESVGSVRRDFRMMEVVGQ